MRKSTVDSIEYNTEDLSDIGCPQLESLQFLEFQMRKIKDETAVDNAAKASCNAGLKSELEKAKAAPAEASAKE